MSSNNVVLNNGQQAIINTNTSKIFIYENRSEVGNYTNSGYDNVTLQPGTLMGRVAATQKLVPLVSSASDGSQFPVGILMGGRVIEPGDTVQLTICNYGDVAEEQIIFQGSDTLSTLVSDRSLRDRISSDTAGIRLVPTNDLTNYDNY